MVGSFSSDGREEKWVWIWLVTGRMMANRRWREARPWISVAYDGIQPRAAAPSQRGTDYIRPFLITSLDPAYFFKMLVVISLPLIYSETAEFPLV